LSKALTELHGGVLEIDSTKDHGTTVTVRMPAYRVMTARRADGHASAAGEARVAKPTLRQAKKIADSSNAA
jgi:hypothetical protein